MYQPLDASCRQIVDYWKLREDECDFGVDWSEAHERCWRCGYKTVLQRCHICPRSMGGADDPSNLVLLCRRCHGEAPNVNDHRFMWIWLRKTNVGFYDSYWTQRGIEEFEKMFGRKPFSAQRIENLSETQMMNMFRKEMGKATIHFGEGRMNPSTIASIIALVEERLIAESAIK